MQDMGLHPSPLWLSPSCCCHHCYCYMLSSSLLFLSLLSSLCHSRFPTTMGPLLVLHPLQVLFIIHVIIIPVGNYLMRHHFTVSCPTRHIVIHFSPFFFLLFFPPSPPAAPLSSSAHLLKATWPGVLVILLLNLLHIVSQWWRFPIPNLQNIPSSNYPENFKLTYS